MNRRPAEADLAPVIGVTSHRIDSGSGHRADDGQHRDYCASLVLAGAAPVLIPLGLAEAALRAIYARLDGLLLPGGLDVAPELYGQQRHPALGGVDPELDRTELTLARWALEDGLPILGICRGNQLLNVAAGGTLYQDIPALLPDALKHAIADDNDGHTVEIDPSSRISAALGGLRSCLANSHHHQAVREPAPIMSVTARSSDGVVEGIERSDAPFALGVQWHPESLVTTRREMLGLFRALTDAARRAGG